MSETGTSFTANDARVIGEEIGINWDTAPFDVEQFRIGMNVELEHGLHDPRTNVSNDDPDITAKIALAHLNEFPDYYTRLERMEEEAKRDWARRNQPLRRNSRLGPLRGQVTGDSAIVSHCSTVPRQLWRRDSEIIGGDLRRRSRRRRGRDGCGSERR